MMKKESPATDSAYSTPAKIEPAPVQPDIGTTLAWFVLLPSAGGFLGCAASVVGAFFLETYVMPTVEPPIYTYGQPFGWITLPTSTAIGFLCGLGLAIFVIGFRWASVIAILGVATLGTLLTYSMWSLDGMGDCNSAIILYFPILGCCAAAFAFGILLGLATVIFARQ